MQHTNIINLVLLAVLAGSNIFFCVMNFKMKRATDEYLKHTKLMREMLDHEIKSHIRFLHYTEFIARSLGYKDPKDDPKEPTLQ